MRKVTKAWLVLADEDGPITGLELPNVVLYDMTAQAEPIMWDLVNSGWSLPNPIELEIRITNVGPFIERLPPANASDRPRGWKPKGSTPIEPPQKEITE
jgi:hypothetical protein